ncbi:MAG: accessory gene regulator B family protein [Clostridia bacterium]|nr:accessory gene regulator B family protein [Clostridia bacterium]
MIEGICKIITKRIRKEMPEMDDEKAEIIQYGLEMIVGEFPKIFLIFIIGYLLGIGNLTLISFFSILPYRTFSGGFHLKTHIGCIIGSTLFFCGNVMISKYLFFINGSVKLLSIVLIWIFSMIMIKLYAPADTENVPILCSSQRKKQRILSYITMTITLIVALLLHNRLLSNILIVGTLFQSLSISRLMYKITKNKYGYEAYEMET